MSTPLHDRVIRYLAASGWRKPEEKGAAGELWVHPASKFTLPIPYQLDRDSGDWAVIAERLALIEDVPVTTITVRFTEQPMDVVNLAAANDIRVKDTIALEAGVTLVQSYWTMLRSSATTAMAPRGYITTYRKSGDDLIAGARLAHTRRGSFIIPILLPLSDPPPDPEPKQDPIPGVSVTAEPEPLERRVMRTFAEALAAIDTVVVQPAKEPQAKVMPELVRAGVSHQFANALHRVLAEQTVSEFSAAFDWAPVGETPTTARKVAIPSEADELVRVVVARLKERAPSRVDEQFVGPIRRVERDPDAETGSVTVQSIRNGRPANVTVRLSPELLDQAWDWARDHRTLVVNSKVERTSDGLIARTNDAVLPVLVEAKDKAESET
ncbi:MAG: hypothetical protein WAV90_26490 [Gordonia amarae]